MKKTLIERIPKIIIRRIYKLARPFILEYWKQVLAQLPKYDLKDKHLKNAKLVCTREELLKRLPKKAVVAEIGVDEGKFSEMILNITQPKKLHLVDFWGSKRYNLLKREKVEHMFASQIDDNLIEINLGLSTQVVNEFPDNYFDWIYIDTSHSYKITIAELEAYRTKVKKNGIIAGHDYITGNWDGMIKYGVIEAVHEFCLNHNWEISFLTNELNNKPSFAIRKIMVNNNKA